MRLPRFRFRAPSLARRITLLTAIAVALSAIVSGVAGYFNAQSSLYAQLDQELLSTAVATGEVVAGDVQNLTGVDLQSLHSTDTILVLLKSDDTRIRPPQQKQLDLGTDELAVARLQQGSSTRTGYASDGQPYRLAAVPLQADDGGRYALVLGRPLGPTLGLLTSLRNVLIVVGLAGVLLSTALGRWVANQSLRPVRQLTEAVTRISRTDVLDPIEVHGHDELSQLSISFNTMLASLASSRARQNRLIADAGHELRTPLTSLRTNIELLVADEKANMLPEGARGEILRDVSAQLREFTSLINDLVQLSRGEYSHPAKELLDLRAPVNSALERARLRGPQLNFEVSLEPWWLQGEHDGLERAITNLLDNAVKFSPAGGTITVTLQDAHLVIADQGPGIAEEDLPHIFDRFYRSDRSRNTPGTGLGLSIVAQTVARHEGWVRAARDESGGAEFTVYLPGWPDQETARHELGLDEPEEPEPVG